MELRFASDAEISTWNELVLANPDGGLFLQSKEMADLKQKGGWLPRFIIGHGVAIVALERHVFGLGKLWYLIKGPGVTTTVELDAILPDLKKLASTCGVFAVKLEPEIIKTDEALVDLMNLGLLKVRNIQPNASTIFLDISGSLEDIMTGLNQKGRHAIRRAERDGATIKQVPATEENCREMYRLYTVTAEGQFAARPYRYYKNFWQGFERSHMGQMFFAYSEGQLVAAAYGLVFGTKSVYKDGASLRERPIYGVSHLLQWHVIQWAKSKGATVHDLLGSPPSDQVKNPNHPYYGFGRFKTSFSKNVVDFVGTYDCIIRPYRYNLWTKFGERLVLRLYFWRHREIFY